MKILAPLIALIATAAFFLIALSSANDSAARRAYAQAAMVREQAQARSDLLAAMLPYIIFGSVIIVCAALSAVVIYALARRPDVVQAEPVKVIERQMIILIQPGQSRREVYRILGGGGRNEKNI
jgi:uncharacterized protein YsxB (DUF464 family)